MITDKIIHRELSESVIGAAMKVLNIDDEDKSPIRGYS
jgi:hypothetical protein